MSRHKYSLYAILCLLLLVISIPLTGCQNQADSEYKAASQSQNTDDNNDTAPVLYTLRTDEEKLLLINYLPLGASYEEVKSLFPTVSELMPEGDLESLGKRGLYEAFLNIHIFDREAKLEFNFKDNRLYSYYFRLDELDKTVSTELYQHLQEFYTTYFGKYTEEQQSEGGYHSLSSSWSADKFELGATNNVYTEDKCILSWGFQSKAK
ncbi:MAG: hypothetical protein H0Z39_04940 [Peptococcaceae bacterium]|nr:hypothetical protein [Peptococcaceae bacterium]